MWRIQKDLNRLDLTDMALDSAAKTIVLKNETIKKASFIIRAQDSAYQAKDFEYKMLRSIHEQEVKQIKRQKLNMTLVAIGEAIVLIIIIL